MKNTLHKISMLPVWIAAKVTRTARYRPTLKLFTGSYISSVFRLWEYIFGKEVVYDSKRQVWTEVIKIESSAAPGFHRSYTFENFCVHSAFVIGQFLRHPFQIKIKKISIELVSPQLAFALDNSFKTQFPGRKFQIPWISFAIAFDAASNGQTNGFAEGGTGGNLSWSHTVTGSNPILIASIHSNGAGGHTTEYTGASYNSVAMTLAGGSKILTHASTNSYGSLWYLTGPATGSNTLATTGSPDLWEFNGCSVSYSGAAQSSQPDNIATAGQTGNNSPKTMSLTTVADNCWLVMSVNNNFDGQMTASTGATKRAETANPYYEAALFDSNSAKTPAGSYSMTVTFGSNDRTSFILISISPYVAATGPANLKTVNGLAKASVKTLEGLAIASTKTYNGLT